MKQQNLAFDPNGLFGKNMYYKNVQKPGPVNHENQNKTFEKIKDELRQLKRQQKLQSLNLTKLLLSQNLIPSDLNDLSEETKTENEHSSSIQAHDYVRPSQDGVRGT
jgi:hypothetical protein